MLCFQDILYDAFTLKIQIRCGPFPDELTSQRVLVGWWSEQWQPREWDLAHTITQGSLCWRTGKLPGATGPWTWVARQARVSGVMSPSRAVNQQNLTGKGLRDSAECSWLWCWQCSQNHWVEQGTNLLQVCLLSPRRPLPCVHWWTKKITFISFVFPEAKVTIMHCIK